MVVRKIRCKTRRLLYTNNKHRLQLIADSTSCYNCIIDLLCLYKVQSFCSIVVYSWNRTITLFEKTQKHVFFCILTLLLIYLRYKTIYSLMLAVKPLFFIKLVCHDVKIAMSPLFHLRVPCVRVFLGQKGFDDNRIPSVAIWRRHAVARQKEFTQSKIASAWLT